MPSGHGVLTAWIPPACLVLIRSSVLYADHFTKGKEMEEELPAGGDWMELAESVRKEASERLKEHSEKFSNGKEGFITSNLPSASQEIFGFLPLQDPLRLSKCSLCSKVIKIDKLAEHKNRCQAASSTIVRAFATSNTTPKKRKSNYQLTSNRKRIKIPKGTLVKKEKKKKITKRNSKIKELKLASIEYPLPPSNVFSLATKMDYRKNGLQSEIGISQ
eukprot:TRINITY_DN2186_c0_g1_i1.p1 TRINITY_DN2186_c0_g1~~TRINITY_DN2186_c0_g1_i1.p1  ORF type:complete len:218 (+),score=38.12 TRINITY_DN2186_c0_g1_i1:875-1528(+)